MNLVNSGYEAITSALAIGRTTRRTRRLSRMAGYGRVIIFVWTRKDISGMAIA
jgi:hypothetical protein